MNEHDATEVAYKNGYRAGKQESQEVIDRLECDFNCWKVSATNTIDNQRKEIARLEREVARLKAVADAELDTIHVLGGDYAREKKPRLFKIKISPKGFGRNQAYKNVYELGANELAERLCEKLYSIPTIYNAHFHKIIYETLTELMTKGE